MAWNFEQLAGPYAFTEGPAWDGSGLLFTDIPNDRILHYDPQTGDSSEFLTGTPGANGLMFDRQGRLYACEGGGRRMVRYEADGSTAVLADRFKGKRLNSPNDLAFDPQGRIWFTDPRYGDRSDLELGHESVYRLEEDERGAWELTRMTYDTTRPNGILVSADGSTLYVAESDPIEGHKKELRAYPIHEDGTLGEHEVLHNFYPHRGIDGMCLDVEGNIIATAGSAHSGPGPMIYVFAASGRVLETHPVPVDMPTNCTFGGPDLSTLYVTASACLFRAETERQGYLQYPPLERG